MGHPTGGGCPGELCPRAGLSDPGDYEHEHGERESAEILHPEEVEQDPAHNLLCCHRGSPHLVYNPLHNHFQQKRPPFDQRGTGQIVPAPSNRLPVVHSLGQLHHQYLSHGNHLDCREDFETLLCIDI